MTKIECIVKAMDDKLAENIVAIDMRNASPLFDTFVLCTASNARLMRAIEQNVTDELAKNGYDVRAVEGLRDSKWILIDCGDIVCHIFEGEERSTYNIEKLWGDMPRIDVGAMINS